MQDTQAKEKSAPDTTKKTFRFTRVQGARKPYLTPTLFKLGDVAKLTQTVSVIV